MRVTYVSDLHMECGIRDVILPGGDILLLGGDIIQESSIHHGHGPTWSKFFNEQFLPKYKRGFFVLGNHEHYQGYVDRTINAFMTEHLAVYPQVQILQNDVKEINDDWMIFGSTLWTDYANNSPNARDSARICMADHRCIAITRRTTGTDGYKPVVGVFRPEDAYDYNQIAKHHLKCAMEDHPEKKWIVLTHHTPSMRSGHPRWGGSENWLNFAFHNTDLDDFITKHENIKFWVHGHTHDSCDYMLGQCRVLCNPKGYGKENKHFDCTKEFEI